MKGLVLASRIFCVACVFMAASGPVSVSALTSMERKGYPSGACFVGVRPLHVSQVARMPTACTATMVTGNGDNEGKLYGAASDYLKKIPSNLRGLAIRNVNKDTFTSKAPKPQYRKGSGDVATEESIMAELGDDGDDLFDQAMDVLELEDVDVSKFDGNLDDAKILRDMKSKMHADDFRALFSGREIGEIL